MTATQGYLTYEADRYAEVQSKPKKPLMRLIDPISDNGTHDSHIRELESLGIGNKSQA